MATDANLPGFGWGFIENVYICFPGKIIKIYMIQPL